MLLFTVFFGFSQESKKEVFSAMFYNVENLFDTIDTPLKQDSDFLPTSKRQWNTPKYYKKLRNISQVIMAAGEWHVPDIIGLCEVETATCLWDITHKTNLSRLEYSYIHYESPDKRGIDVALLYNTNTCKVLHSNPIRVSSDSIRLQTRDILYAKLLVRSSNDTIHVFICHFPSRMGGEAKSEPKRIHAARLLRAAIDSIFCINNSANIVVLGDFNDSPQNTSISKVLQAVAYTPGCSQCIVSVVDSSLAGTHYYKGEWSYLDQSMVSSHLYSMYTVTQTIVNHSFLFKTNQRSNTVQPYRTYNGTYYSGGYSDHLPIVLRLYSK